MHARWQSAETIAIERARKDPAAFCAFVLRDEEKNLPIKMRPMHREWQALLSANSRFLVWSHIEGGKTTQIPVGRVLWEIGKNPNIRVALVSNTAKQAIKLTNLIAKYITESVEYKAVFPHVVPAAGATWANGNLFIERDTRSKDPTIQACGVHGNVLGSRLDILVLDDILDFENTLNDHQRVSLKAWVRATLFGRITKQGRIWAVGTAWHPQDLYHDLASAWEHGRYPLVVNGESTWPERWPLDRIEAARAELGPLEAARQFDLKARSDAESRFKETWITQCLALGEGRALTQAVEYVPAGCGIFTGVDLGVGKKNSDLTVMFTILLHPNETREVLAIESGRWKAPEIVERIVDTHYRFQSLVMVESNAAQDFIVQFTKSLSAVPVKAFHTGTNKHNPQFGIESIATEMESAKWIIPSRGGRPANDEIRAWVAELMDYKPSAHTGDRLMACWFAREAARQFRDKKIVRQGHLDLLSR